jgi:uncharacterized protein YndB with AHSA1/START domain
VTDPATPTTTTVVPAIERTHEFRAGIDRVWRALSDPAELSQWFGQRADLHPEVGYEGWMEWDGYGRFAMRVEEAIEPTRLALRWMNEPGRPFDEARSSLVEWDLEPMPDGGTRLHLRESGLRDASSRAGNTVGWLSELAELTSLLATEPWEAGIRRTYRFRSTVERVWAAFADPTQFGTWWGAGDPTDMRPGAVGWWDWPTEGRYAYRIDRVEPPTCLAWTWTTAPDVGLDEATELLHTEWALEAREDGGTDLHLLETGFTGPDNYRRNTDGWDTDVSSALRRVLDEPAT